MPQLEVTKYNDFREDIMLLSSTGLTLIPALLAFGQNSEGWNYLSISTFRRLHCQSFGMDK